MFISLAALLPAQTGAVARDSEQKTAAAGSADRISDPSYILGPGDEISVWVRDLESVNAKPIRVETDGFISLPVAGRVKASGLTAHQLENALESKLKSQLLEPLVTVGIVEFHSQPVSVMGAVNHPGVYQVQGKKSLIEVLSLAEGLRPEAGYTITVTRKLQYGRIPFPGAADDQTGQYSVAKIPLKGGLLDGSNPASNIAMQPDDVVSVPKAEMIYVMGEVKKQGGFTLNDHETITLLQAVALAEGMNRTASSKGAKILRVTGASGDRTEIPVNLSKVLDGKGEDLRLQPNDILYIPNSASKSATIRALQSAVEIGTGVLIWHR
jgi:polysaccharide export outer membrane protein